MAVERLMDERLVSEEMRLQNGKVDFSLISLRFYSNCGKCCLVSQPSHGKLAVRGWHRS